MYRDNSSTMEQLTLRQIPSRQRVDELFVTIATVYLVIADIFIVLGNSWVIWIIISKLRKSMYLLSSLVLSDLLMGLLSIPLYLLWLHQPDLFVSKIICYGTLMTSLFLSTASILNIVAMTMERYIAICYPLFHKSFVRCHFRTVILMSVCLVWSVSFAVSASSMIFMKDVFSVCSYYNMYDRNFLFWAIVVGVFSPFCLLLAMYIRMFLSVKKSFKREVGRTRLSSTSSEMRQKAINKSKRKMLTTLCLVLASFILCWFPFFITIFLRLVCRWCELALLAYEIILLLGMTNSLLNPIIYCLRHQTFVQISGRMATRQNLINSPEVSSER